MLHTLFSKVPNTNPNDSASPMQPMITLEKFPWKRIRAWAGIVEKFARASPKRTQTDTTAPMKLCWPMKKILKSSPLRRMLIAGIRRLNGILSKSAPKMILDKKLNIPLNPPVTETSWNGGELKQWYHCIMTLYLIIFVDGKYEVLPVRQNIWCNDQIKQSREPEKMKVLVLQSFLF